MKRSFVNTAPALYCSIGCKSKSSLLAGNTNWRRRLCTVTPH